MTCPLQTPEAGATGSVMEKSGLRVLTRPGGSVGPSSRITANVIQVMFCSNRQVSGYMLILIDITDIIMCTLVNFFIGDLK